MLLPVSILLVGSEAVEFQLVMDSVLIFQLFVMARNIKPCGTKAVFVMTLVDHNTNASHQTQTIWHLLLYHHMALRTLSYAILRQHLAPAALDDDFLKDLFLFFFPHLPGEGC